MTPDGGLLVGGTTGFRENRSLYTVEHEVADSYDVFINNIVFEQRERISYEAVGMLEWWRLPSGKPIQTLDCSGQVQCLTVTPDGGLLIAGINEDGGETISPFAKLWGTVQLWHVPSGLPAGKWEGTGVVSCLAVTPDGALLATGSYDRTVRLWRLRSEVARRKPVRDISSAEVQHLRQSYGALRPVDHAWVELITALVLRHRRHDIEVVDAPHKVAGECDVELDG